MSKNGNEKEMTRIFMPQLDAEAIAAVVACFTLRAHRLEGGDVVSLTLKLDLLKRAEKARAVLERKFPNHTTADSQGAI